jgi:(p)ppGpp synthase/HD superfamily hydrolase
MTHAERAEIVARTAFCRDWPALAHTTRVVEELKAMDDATDEEIAAAWLHDVIEDTDVDYVDLADIGFPPHVIAMVRILTRDGPYLEDYEAYKARLFAASGSTGRAVKRVKLADARENLKRCEDAKGVPKWERLGRTRYAPMVAKLEADLRH